MRIIICLALAVLLFSCNDKEYHRHFNAENQSERNISINELFLDSFYLDYFDNSQHGDFSISDGSILYIDFTSCIVSEFDSNGRFKKSLLGKGNGPEEIPTNNIDAYHRLLNGNHLFVVPPWDIHIFDSRWGKVKSFRIDYQSDIRDVYANPKPSPDDPRLYAPHEIFIVKSNSKGEVFWPLYSEHRNFNPITSPKYYTKGRIIALLDINTESITKLYGRRSPEYLKYNLLGHHSSVVYDIDSKDNFHICHEIDSLIYVYNDKFDLQYTYGYSGKNMDTDYKELSVLDTKKFRELYFKDRPNRGHYYDIKYFDEEEILFRSYRKGGRHPNDGLQIYKSGVLIADVEIPIGLKVVGYIGSKFYSNAFYDTKSEQIKVYTFNLNL